MKYLILMPLLAALCFYGCKDDAPTPKERIVGTWVGVEYPEIDTAFFYDTDTVRFVGRAGSGDYRTYTIDEEYIHVMSPGTSITTNHRYEFEQEGRVYIRLMTSIGVIDDSGIEFEKQ